MIDAEALGKSFYNFGVALGNATNHLMTALENFAREVDKCALARELYRYNKSKVHRKHERPVLTAEEYATKSNNWLHMHGYPTRRRGGKRK